MLPPAGLRLLSALLLLQIIAFAEVSTNFNCLVNWFNNYAVINLINVKLALKNYFSKVFG
jgi:hypothetical protein